MVRLHLALAVVAASALSASATSSRPAVRGISPQDIDSYIPFQTKDGQLRWKCLDQSAEISWNAVNDDFCDCPDGSDEPGTSACPNSTFYCQNEGHLPSRILSSRVNDGICDPECCDGSDETDGKVQCRDRCDKVGKEYRKKTTELQNIQRAGGKIRDKYIADGQREKETLEAEIVKLQAELNVATENEARLKQALERAESQDKAIIEAKVKTPLYATLQSHQQAMQALLSKNDALKDELKTLALMLDDLAKGYNPNYQDMAVKGAVVAYKEWRGIKPESDETSGQQSQPAADESSSSQDNSLDDENQKLGQLFDEGEWDSVKVQQLVRENLLEIMDGGLDGAANNQHVDGGNNDGGLLFRIHEYLPDAVVPYFEAMVDTLLDVLLKANVITDVKRMRPKKSDFDHEDDVAENVAVARKAHNEALNQLHKIQNDLDHRQNKLNQFDTKYGRQLEFKALEGKCISKDFGEYTYEYCFFGRAKQIPNKGGAQVSLGSFGLWNPNQDFIPNQDQYWLQQLYENGQRCWNGPDRTAIVDLICDTNNAVLDVFEAEKCIYSIKVSTPAVCFPLSSSKDDDDVKKDKDEL